MRSTMRLQVVFLLLLGVAVSSTIADQRRLGVAVSSPIADQRRLGVADSSTIADQRRLGVAVVSARILDRGSCLSKNIDINYEDALEVLNVMRGKPGQLYVPSWQKGVILATVGTAKFVVNSVTDINCNVDWTGLALWAAQIVQGCMFNDNDNIYWVRAGDTELSNAEGQLLMVMELVQNPSS